MRRGALVCAGLAAATLGCWTDPAPRSRAACPEGEEARVSSPNQAIPAIDRRTWKRQATATFALG